MVADRSIGRRDQIPRGRSPSVVREWGRVCGTEGCLKSSPEVPHKPAHEKPDEIMERKLEQGLEESMAGSGDPSSASPWEGGMRLKFCAVCGSRTEDLERHFVIPLSEGGIDDETNQLPSASAAS